MRLFRRRTAFVHVLRLFFCASFAAFAYIYKNLSVLSYFLFVESLDDTIFKVLWFIESLDNSVLRVIWFFESFDDPILRVL